MKASVPAALTIETPAPAPPLTEAVAVVAGAQVAEALTTLATRSEVPPFKK